MERGHIRGDYHIAIICKRKREHALEIGAGECRRTGSIGLDLALRGGDFSDGSGSLC